MTQQCTLLPLCLAQSASVISLLNLLAPPWAHSIRSANGHRQRLPWRVCHSFPSPRHFSLLAMALILFGNTRIHSALFAAWKYLINSTAHDNEVHQWLLAAITVTILFAVVLYWSGGMPGGAFGFWKWCQPSIVGFWLSFLGAIAHCTPRW